MHVYEKELLIPHLQDEHSLIRHFGNCCRRNLTEGEEVVRFVVTRTDLTGYHCEMSVLVGAQDIPGERRGIFHFRPRPCTDTRTFNAVLIVPTGIGAEIGGHAGDANAVARLIASACDTLVTHPNVINASDINELPENGLYVEGSVLTRLLMGTCALQRVRANRLLMVIDQHAEEIMMAPLINAASAARATLGVCIPEVIAMRDPVQMKTSYSESGRAVGEVKNLEGLCRVLAKHRDKYDAAAIASVIDVSRNVQLDYLKARGDIINPWGGVEAMLTHAISHLYSLPSAHAPILASSEQLSEISEVVDPRMAAEELSSAFIHCVLKGLQRSPQIVTDSRRIDCSELFASKDIDCLIVPDGCLGLPVLAAVAQDIPLIAVRDNHNRMLNDLKQLPFRNDRLFLVDSYLEAVGMMTAIRAGISLESVQRPLRDTHVSFE